ncbi:hypothetical protein [Thermomonas sp.]|uniref:hypothetical protein n=1 Tax=Thermomonas sp. TaxID=1971895 RepID=UPI0035AEAA57
MNKRSALVRHQAHRICGRLTALLQHASTRINSINSRRPWLKNIISTLLMGSGLIFVIHALREQMETLLTTGTSVHLPEYASLASLATLTTLITASLHAEILAQHAKGIEIDRRLTRYAYAISQVARYIPGKIFGVILESQMLGPSIGITRVLKATLLQTVLVYAWAGFISISILAATMLNATWLLLLAPAAIPLLWSRPGNRLLLYVGSAIKLQASPQPSQMQQDDDDRRNSLLCMLLLALQWIPFFAMWLLITGTDHGISEALWLGASYLLASIAGSILVFAPSGLIVREAAFIWLGGLHGIPAASLLIWAIVMRIALTLADVMAIPLLWAALRLRNGK